MSGQRGRAKYSNIDLLDKYHYVSLRHLIFKGNIMDFDLLFDEFPNRIIPYDYPAYAACPERYEMVTTSCRTGRACYFEEKNDPERIIDIVRASSSLPFVCPPTEVDGIPMLDGGISDSIPLQRAIDMGHTFNVVVLTRNEGYRSNSNFYRRSAFLYRKYPALRRTLERRREMYNEQISFVEEMERQGKALVIRPQRPLEVSRLCTDTTKMMRLYEEGYNEAKRAFTKFLGN
jgi:predicted patatin/cPLA2 family phospholipase